MPVSNGWGQGLGVCLALAFVVGSFLASKVVLLIVAGVAVAYGLVGIVRRRIKITSRGNPKGTVYEGSSAVWGGLIFVGFGLFMIAMSLGYSP